MYILLEQLNKVYFMSDKSKNIKVWDFILSNVDWIKWFGCVFCKFNSSTFQNTKQILIFVYNKRTVLVYKRYKT